MKSSKNTPDFTHKHKLKNSTSRPNCKLESIQLQSTVHNHCNIGVAPNPANPKKQQPLHKGDNTKSGLFRNLKIQSMKADNQKIDEGKHESNLSPPRCVLQKIENRERKKDQSSLEMKDNNGKNFMIRKKNLSSYAKKQDEQLSKFQIDLFHLPKISPHETLLLASQNLKKMQRQQNQSQNSSNHQIKENRNHELKNEFLHTGLINNTSGVKVRPVICKKQHFEQSICFQQKDLNNLKIQKHIQKMIKKVRKSSKSQYQINSKHGQHEFRPSVIAFAKDQQKELFLEQKVSKQQKQKGFNGCKTIRIAWGQNKMQMNSGKNVEIKVKSEDRVDKDDVFGGLSAITHQQQAYGKEIESLKQLFRQLNHQQQAQSVISKQLIES